MIYTLGYEKRDITEFVDILKNNKISIVIDVRELPFSYKKGFSKTPLIDFLKEYEINYLHMKELGVPRTLRNSLKNKEIELYDYMKHYYYYAKEKTAELDYLNRISSDYNICLICFERNYKECHRNIITGIMINFYNKNPKHL